MNNLTSNLCKNVANSLYIAPSHLATEGAFQALGLNEEGAFFKNPEHNDIDFRDDPISLVDSLARVILKSGSLCIVHAVTEKTLSTLGVSYPSIPMASIFLGGLCTSIHQELNVANANKDANNQPEPLST